MAVFVKLTDSVVTARVVQQSCPEGFIPAPDDVYCGYVYKNGAFSPPSMSFELQKQLLLDQARATKQEKLYGGVFVDGVLFDTDIPARVAYQELAFLFQRNPTETVQWKASDGVWITMTAALFEKLQTAFRQHLENVFSFYCRFCSDVENATTEQELEMLKQKLTSSWSLYD